MQFILKTKEKLESYSPSISIRSAMTLKKCKTWVLMALVCAYNCCPTKETIEIFISPITLKAETWEGFSKKESTRIEFNEYWIVLDLRTTNFNPMEYEDGRNGFLWTSDCSEPDLNVFLMPSVNKIQVITRLNLMEGYPAGSDVSSLFDAYVLDKNPDRQQPMTISLKGMELEGLNSIVLEHTLIRSFDVQEPFRFYALKPSFELSENIETYFTIIVTLENGNTLTADTRTVLWTL